MSDYILRGALVIDEEIRYVDRSFETASAYEVLLLQPGRYPFKLTMIGGGPWIPGHVSPGNVQPGGPYYAKTEVDAQSVETYYENRLLSHTSATKTLTNKPTKHHVRLYHYELYSKKTLFESQARIELPDYWRENTYPCIERLDDSDYDRVLSMGIKWLADHGYGDYRNNPHYHVWNRINANAMAGTDGWVKAILEDKIVRGADSPGGSGALL